MKNKQKEKRHLIRELKDQIRTHKSTFTVYLILRAFVIFAMITSVIRGQYENLFVCTLALILFMAPSFIEKNFGIELPSTLEIIVLLFIFAAEILGEIQNYYMKIPYWDTMLHTINGFMFAAVGFALVDLFNRNKKFTFKLSPVFLALVAFCFSMTIGVLWEFFEFGCDAVLKTDMQKDTIVTAISSVSLDPTNSNTPVIIKDIHEVSVNGTELGLGGYLDIGLIDTMKDLFVNFIGAVIFSIIGYFYVKSRGKGRFAKHFIPTVNEEVPPLFARGGKANPENQGDDIMQESDFLENTDMED